MIQGIIHPLKTKLTSSKQGEKRKEEISPGEKNFISYPFFLCYQRYEHDIDTVADVGKLPNHFRTHPQEHRARCVLKEFVGDVWREQNQKPLLQTPKPVTWLLRDCASHICLDPQLRQRMGTSEVGCQRPTAVCGRPTNPYPSIRQHQVQPLSLWIVVPYAENLKGGGDQRGGVSHLSEV